MGGPRGGGKSGTAAVRCRTAPIWGMAARRGGGAGRVCRPGGAVRSLEDVMATRVSLYP